MASFLLFCLFLVVMLAVGQFLLQLVLGVLIMVVYGIVGLASAIYQSVKKLAGGN